MFCFCFNIHAKVVLTESRPYKGIPIYFLKALAKFRKSLDQINQGQFKWPYSYSVLYAFMFLSLCFIYKSCVKLLIKEQEHHLAPAAHICWVTVYFLVVIPEGVPAMSLHYVTGLVPPSIPAWYSIWCSVCTNMTNPICLYLMSLVITWPTPSHLVPLFSVLSSLCPPKRHRKNLSLVLKVRIKAGSGLLSHIKMASPAWEVLIFGHVAPH